MKPNWFKKKIKKTKAFSKSLHVVSLLFLWKFITDNGVLYGNTSFEKSKNKNSFVPKIFPKLSCKAVVVGGGNWRFQMPQSLLPAIGLNAKAVDHNSGNWNLNTDTMVVGNWKNEKPQIITPAIG